MNCVYRLIRNHTQRAWIAAPEPPRSQGKGRGGKVILRMLAMTLLLVGSGHRAQAATITNTNGDLSAGSVRAAAATNENIYQFNDLGASATINLLGPLNFNVGSAASWNYTGNTTSVTIGGDDITADSHLYFTLSNPGNSLTINSNITFTGTGDVALVADGTVTFNGDISDVGKIWIIGGGTAVLGTTTSTALIDIAGDSTLRLGTDAAYTSNIEIEDTATIDTGTHDVTFSGVVSDDGTNALVKTGTGTLTLSGANTYSGTTTVSAGTLSVSANNNLGTGALILDGGTLQTTSSFSTNRATTLNAGGGTFNTDAGTTLTHSGQISGTGTLTKTGTGTLVLNATNNSYSGGTVASQGTLRLEGLAVNDAGNIDIANGATVELNPEPYSGVFYYDVISGEGNLVKTGAGTVILRNANNYSGGTTISNGTLSLDSTAGSITGDVVNNGTLQFTRTNAYTFAGDISGNGAVTKGDVSTLTLTGTNTYSGGTTVSGGALMGTTTSLQGSIVNNATVGFDQTTDGTYAGVMSGSGALTKAGSGTVILSGTNNYSGPTTIDGGILSVNGSLTSDVAVNSGGTLGGNGTVGSVTLNGGAIGPGNSIGTLNVTGDIDFSGGGIYQVEVDAAGNADRIIASGTATLAGGSVQVLPEAGSYNYSTGYTILTAGSISGSFDSVSSSLVFLDPTLSYDSNNVYLNLTRNDVTFTSVASTPNQQAVSTALTTIAGSGPSGDMTTILNEIATLTADGAQQAYDSLSGVQHAATQSLLMGIDRHFAGVLSARTRHLSAGPGRTSKLAAFRPVHLAYNGGHGSLQLASGSLAGEPLTPQGSGFWLNPQGGAGEIDDTDNATGLDYTWYSIYGGADTWFDSQRLLGFALGASRSDADLYDGDAHIDSMGLALYGRWQDGTQYVAANLIAGYNQTDTSRRVIVGTLQRTATADYDSRSLGFAVEGGRRVFEQDGWQITPFAGLRYARLHRDGFTESGAGSANLVVDSDTQESLMSRLGVHAQQDSRAGRRKLNWDVTAAWAHEFRDTVSTLNTGFEGVPSTIFTIDGPELDRNRLQLAAGLTTDLHKDTTLRIGYDGELASSDNRHTVSANLTVKW